MNQTSRKSNYLLYMALFCIITHSTTFADSSGLSESATNIGGGTKGIEFQASIWCREMNLFLFKYLSRSIDKVETTGNYFAANGILYSGLTKGMDSLTQKTTKSDAKSKGDTDTGGPSKRNIKTFTQKALERGLEFFSTLNVNDSNNDQRRNRFLFSVFTAYYHFILKNAVPFDIRWGLSSNQSKSPFDVREFELAFVNYGRHQLNWILQYLVNDNRASDYATITPKGNAEFFLSAARLFSLATANDLQNSNWQNRFSCVINRLRDLNSNLEDFNRGNSAMYESTAIAVVNVYLELQTIITQISLEDSCLNIR